MRRRALLARTVALGAIGLAGCFGDGGASGTPTPTDTDRPPAIDTSSIETRGTDCGTGDGGRVDALEADASNHSLRVEGTLPASNPCFLAELAATDLAEETLTLTVGVRRDEEVDACVDCVGAVDYGATVTLTAGLDAEVVLQHQYREEVTEITRETVAL